MNFTFAYVSGNSIIQAGGANPLVGGEKSKYNIINEKIIMDKEGDLYFVAKLIGAKNQITVAHTLKLIKNDDNSTGWKLWGIEAKSLAIKHNISKIQNHKFLILQPKNGTEKELPVRKKQFLIRHQKFPTFAESWKSAKEMFEGLSRSSDVSADSAARWCRTG